MQNIKEEALQEKRKVENKNKNYSNFDYSRVEKIGKENLEKLGEKKMKKKLLILTIIIVLIVPLFLNIYKVQAYTGKIDPENYITLPSTIWIKNKVGTGTVTLSSSASGYNISYQKVDITKDKLDSIKATSNAIKDYIEKSNKTIKEKEANLAILQKTYQDLQKNTTATKEQIETAKTNYETEYAKYTEYYQNAKKELEKLKAENLELIPNYTNSWKATTNTSNNIQLDFSNYTGTTHFVLWVKIDNGTNTYYDCMGYSSDIKEESKEEPKEEKKDNSDTKEESLTDFSKAKFELKKDGISDAIVEISDVSPKENSSYYLLITQNSSKPTVDEKNSKEKIILVYDKDSKTLKSSEGEKVANYVELNQDLYANVVEVRQGDSKNNVVSFGNKLTRYSEAKYSDAFHATFMTNDADQIITNFTHSQSNNRKLQIKIGKITDISILNKIKSKNSTGFEELLNYAKLNSGIYNKTMDADKDDWFAIEYNAGSTASKENSVINLANLENEGYYFLYIKTDDENGKYVSNEAVTLAQASVNKTGWGLFFYGSSDFKWKEWGTTANDDSVAKGVLPKAGVEYVIYAGIILLISISAFIAYIKHRKYNF